MNFFDLYRIFLSRGHHLLKVWSWGLVWASSRGEFVLALLLERFFEICKVRAKRLLGSELCGSWFFSYFFLGWGFTRLQVCCCVSLSRLYDVLADHSILLEDPTITTLIFIAYFLLGSLSPSTHQNLTEELLLLLLLIQLFRENIGYVGWRFLRN